MQYSFKCKGIVKEYRSVFNYMYAKVLILHV